MAASLLPSGEGGRRPDEGYRFKVANHPWRRHPSSSDAEAAPPSVRSPTACRPSKTFAPPFGRPLGEGKAEAELALHDIWPASMSLRDVGSDEPFGRGWPAGPVRPGEGGPQGRFVLPLSLRER